MLRWLLLDTGLNECGIRIEECAFMIRAICGKWSTIDVGDREQGKGIK